MRKALGAADLEALIGLEECGWMDVKSQPYMLDKGAHHKEELVKDVAAFANTPTGGLLLIGFRTSTANAVETVSQVAPVPRDLVNTDTYRKLIDERVFPQVQDLELTWIGHGEGKGVLVIDIPAQPAAARPFVIPAPTGRDERPAGGFAVPVRRGDRTAFWSTAEAHRRLSAGWMAIGAPTADGTTPQNVSGEAAAADSAAPDRAKAQRILTAMPFDAAWLRFLQAQGPMRRVKVDYTQALGKALDELLFDDVDFLDAELGRTHAAFKESLGRLHTELDGMFTPNDGPTAPVYIEVPPEWKLTAPERYTQMMAALSGARDDFLEARAELVNALNRKGLLA